MAVKLYLTPRHDEVAAESEASRCGFKEAKRTCAKRRAAAALRDARDFAELKAVLAEIVEVLL